jgi:hypothetical protein
MFGTMISNGKTRLFIWRCVAAAIRVVVAMILVFSTTAQSATARICSGVTSEKRAERTRKRTVSSKSTERVLPEIIASRLPRGLLSSRNSTLRMRLIQTNLCRSSRPRSDAKPPLEQDGQPEGQRPSASQPGARSGRWDVAHRRLKEGSCDEMCLIIALKH